MNCQHNQPGAARGPSASRKAALLFATLLAAVAAYYLWRARPEQFFAALPFLAFLICPLMMFFMMRGMGAMGSDGDADSSGHKGSDPSAIQKPEAR